MSIYPLNYYCTKTRYSNTINSDLCWFVQSGFLFLRLPVILFLFCASNNANRFSTKPHRKQPGKASIEQDLQIIINPRVQVPSRNLYRFRFFWGNGKVWPTQDFAVTIEEKICKEIFYYGYLHYFCDIPTNFQ